MDPYRGDRDSLLAMLADAQQRATRAEERARVAEAALKRRRLGLWLQARAEEILVVRGSDGLQFLGPGESVLAFRRHVLGALPAERAMIQARWEAIPMRDGVADLDVVVMVGIGADLERREAAIRQFLDRPSHEMVDTAAPILAATLRSVLGVRRVYELDTSLNRIGQDLRLSSQAALRDLGLDVGDVVLNRHGSSSQ